MQVDAANVSVSGSYLQKNSLQVIGVGSFCCLHLQHIWHKTNIKTVRLSHGCWYKVANKPQQKWSSVLRSLVNMSDHTRLQQQLQHHMLSSHYENQPASSPICLIHTCNRGKKSQLSLRSRQRCAYAKMRRLKKKKQKKKGELRRVYGSRTDMLSSVSEKLVAAFTTFKIIICNKRYWRSHLDRHAGCDVSCTGQAQAPGIRMRAGMAASAKSQMLIYIFSQVS